MTNNAFQYQLAAAFTAMQCRNHAGASEAIYESGDPWRPRDREPITGIWEQSPSGVQGQSPWLRVFFSFWTSNGSGKICCMDCIWQTQYLWCLY